VERVVSTLLRAALVQESARFTFRELTSRRGVRRYRLRESKLRIHLRHATPDIFGLEQAFLQRLYEPPRAVSERLRRLDRPLRAVDLGGNIGTFGLHFLARFADASLTSFEPDPENARLLAATIEANHKDCWQLVEACAAVEDGTVRFASGKFGLSGTDEEGNIDVAALDVFPYLADADMIKIDIEGSEWSLLADARFAGLAATVVHLEYHERLCPHRDPEAEARRSLQVAGFSLEPSRAGTLWGWRP
jgi:FkbM family methyltransferase